VTAPEPTLEERIRQMYERLGIAPKATPAPPPDAAPPPRHWSDDRDDDDTEAAP